MENFQPNKINQDFSKRITTLRFPLACLVIFIHFKVTEVNLAGKMMAVTAPLYVEIIRHLIANVWGGIAVPLFFIISGYLFAAKPKPAKVTVKSKFQGIVVPYILWTLITAALFFAAQSFAFTRPYFTQENYTRYYAKTHNGGGNDFRKHPSKHRKPVSRRQQHEKRCDPCPIQPFNIILVFYLAVFLVIPQ